MLSKCITEVRLPPLKYKKLRYKIVSSYFKSECSTFFTCFFTCSQVLQELSLAVCFLKGWIWCCIVRFSFFLSSIWYLYFVPYEWSFLYFKISLSLVKKPFFFVPKIKEIMLKWMRNWMPKRKLSVVWYNST